MVLLPSPHRENPPRFGGIFHAGVEASGPGAPGSGNWLGLYGCCHVLCNFQDCGGEVVDVIKPK